jgi:hypothetical protein
MELLNVMEDVKGTKQIPLMDDEIEWVEGTCELESSGDTILSKVDITTVPIAWQKGWCNQKLAGFFAQQALRPGASAQYQTLPFEAEISNYLTKLNALIVEKSIWQSDSDLSTGSYQFFDGLIKLFSTGAVVEANEGGYTTFGTATSGTTIDIYAALVAMRNAMISEDGNVAREQDFSFFIGEDLAELLVSSYITKNFFHINPNDQVSNNRDTMQLFGYNVPIEVVPGLTNTSKVYGFRKSRTFVGVDLRSDSDSFELWYEKKPDQIMARSHFNLGTQTAYKEEVVKFTLEDASSS